MDESERRIRAFANLFDDGQFNRSLRHRDAVAAFMRQDLASFEPSLEWRRRLPGALIEALRGREDLLDWLTSIMREPLFNAFGPDLGRPVASHDERLGLLLYLIAALRPGIETLLDERPPTPSGPPAPADPLVSIIVLAWNQWAETRLCLESILALTRRPSFEIIAVDNGSTDETPEELARLAERTSLVRPLRIETNLGFSEGNNRGVASARGRYLLFLNNDVVIQDRRWLRRLVEALESHPRIGAAGQFGVLDLEGEAPSPACFQRIFLPGFIVPVAWLSGYCLLVRREAFEVAGRWRGDLYGMAGTEDIHLGYALRRAGWISVVPAHWVPVHHRISRTRNDSSARRALAVEKISGTEKEARFRAHFGDRRRRVNYAIDETPVESPEILNPGL
jgi:GT2 family glycosyltransferase